MTTPRTISPDRRRWLEHELEGWRADGLIAPDTAGAILARYVVHRRFSLVRVMVVFGGAFLGVGLIWLVAANLDLLSPLLRFLLVALVWLGLMALAEFLARRADRAGDPSSPVVGLTRLLSAAAFGAVVFQGAQSLQVTAYEPGLLGVWSAGSILLAYAVRSVPPLVLGVPLGLAWFAWQSAVSGVAPGAVLFAFLLAGILAAALAALHRGPWAPFGEVWRLIGVASTLIGLFFASLPWSARWSAIGWPSYVAIVLATLLVLLALNAGDRLAQGELGVALVATLVGVGLLLWSPASGAWAGMSPTDPRLIPRAVVAVAAYLLITSAYAVLGTLRGNPAVTFLATAALVLFVTVQAFAVFAPILPGSLVFLVVGAVLVVSGLLADRGRRRLVQRAQALALTSPIPSDPLSDPASEKEDRS